MNNENTLFSFSEKGDECIINQNKNIRTPIAWSNILTNKHFGTIVTDSMGGFTWYINSKNNRITKFENDAYTDNSSEYFTITEKNNMYSLDVNNLPDDNNYKTTFGFGYSIFEHETENIKTSLTMFVPIKNEEEQDNLKVNSLKIKNKTNKKIEITIKYNILLQIGENEKESYIKENYKENFKMFTEKNLANEKDYIIYISASEYINEEKEININLDAMEEKQVNIILGAAKDEIEALENATNAIQNVEQKLNETKEYWKNITKKCTCKTPDEAFDIMQNGWLAYQAIASRLYAKTGFYQTSGAYGYRDQMQDAIGMKWVDENILKKQIIINANHQFLEGDVMHWWHEDEKLGIRTRYSDDLLFLPYGIIEYINFTGDYEILNEKAKYIIEEELRENEKDRVIRYKQSTKEYTILDHFFKAIERASRFGKNNLPLMQSGDWNDGMNKIGEKEKGESVWLGFFMYYILSQSIPILEYISDKSEHFKINQSAKEPLIKQIEKNEKTISEEIEKNKIKSEIEKYKQIMQKLKLALNGIGWDGRWFKRAIDDNQNEVGSNQSIECKIDNEVQAWAVMSNAADNDKKFIAMQSVTDMLVDEKHNLVKLLSPALEKINLGYISSYPKGVRENGGQYTHAVIWDVIASCMLNKNDQAFEMLKKANPIEHTKSKEALSTYKVEPYVVAADIYSNENLAGRGGWTWYTGSAAWMYEAQTKYILGLNIYHKKIRFDPHVPSSWSEYKFTFKYKNAIYNINAKRISEKEKSINNNATELKEKSTNNNETILKESKIDNNEIELKEKGIYNINIFY